jgi:hypothetical protein
MKKRPPDDADKIMATARKIGEKYLAGRPPQDISAILADLTAMWLAGFQSEDGIKARPQLLTEHVELIIKLVPEKDLRLREHYGKLVELIAELFNAPSPPERKH